VNAQARAFFARLGEIFNRKTMRGFVECVPSLRELDPVFREPFEARLDPASPPLFILHFPSQSILTRRGAYPWLPAAFLPWQITSRRVLVMTESCLWDAALPFQSVGPPELCSFPLESLLWLEIGYELLDAWFAWAPGGEDGVQAARVHFNTVGRPQVEAFCARLRAQLTAPSGVASPRPELLAGLPYAFQTLVPRLLLPTDPLQDLAFCPAGKATPAILFVRSARELVAARQQLGADGRICGMRSQFIPLVHLRAVEFRADALDLDLSGAAGRAALSLPCPAASQPALRALLSPILVF
jgi:hypothetical protein